jgi:uncharacterized membrane protein
MTDARLPRLLFWFLVAAAAVQILIYYPQLPGRLASHFNGAGTPNGWQTKTAFFSFYVGGIVLATVLCFGVPKLIGAMPTSAINLQNKEYWLAPERRAETLAYLANFFGWFACAVFFVELAAFHFAIAANLHAKTLFDSAALFWVLGAFFVFLIVWIARLITHFARTPPK